MLLRVYGWSLCCFFSLFFIYVFHWPWEIGTSSVGLIKDTDPGRGPNRKIFARKGKTHWALVIFSVLSLIVVQFAASLLNRYYFDYGGNNRWISTLVQQDISHQYIQATSCMYLFNKWVYQYDGSFHQKLAFKVNIPIGMCYIDMWSSTSSEATLAIFLWSHMSSICSFLKCVI